MNMCKPLAELEERGREKRKDRRKVEGAIKIYKKWKNKKHQEKKQ